MNNIERLQELRKIAISRGFPPLLDKQFYIATGVRLDNKSYIAYNSDSSLLFYPEWVEKLVGSDMVKSTFFDKNTLDYLEMPAFEYAMVEMIRIRANKGDAIGYLYDKVKHQE